MSRVNKFAHFGIILSAKRPFPHQQSHPTKTTAKFTFNPNGRTYQPNLNLETP
ncbi:MAG: hypothetical protein GY805_03265 [Chloroflexi bacterium]|nr:hypothetical protein [Chloroflexota bacterium]